MISLEITSNFDTVRANFFNRIHHRGKTALWQEIQQIVVKHGEKVYQRVWDFVPKDTWFMAEQLKLNVTLSGMNYVVGWYAADFESQGRRFYAPYVELGSRGKTGYNMLFRAQRENRPLLKAEVARAISRVLAKKVV